MKEITLFLLFDIYQQSRAERFRNRPNPWVHLPNYTIINDDDNMIMDIINKFHGYKSKGDCIRALQQVFLNPLRVVFDDPQLRSDAHFMLDYVHMKVVNSNRFIGFRQTRRFMEKIIPNVPHLLLPSEVEGLHTPSSLSWTVLKGKLEVDEYSDFDDFTKDYDTMTNEYYTVRYRFRNGIDIGKQRRDFTVRVPCYDFKVVKVDGGNIEFQLKRNFWTECYNGNTLYAILAHQIWGDIHYEREVRLYLAEDFKEDKYTNYVMTDIMTDTRDGDLHKVSLLSKSLEVDIWLITDTEIKCFKPDFPKSYAIMIMRSDEDGECHFSSVVTIHG